MKYRLFGRTGLRVSELLLGTMTFDDPAEAGRIVDAYADAGGNVLDTASAYGRSEELIGSVVRRRDRFVLGTKYTLSRDAADPNASGNHRKNLTVSLERSLRRLRTDHVDLYWVHIWDRHTPVEETLRALDGAVRAGKVLCTGISDAPAWVVSRANTLADWRGWTPFTAGAPGRPGLAHRAGTGGGRRRPAGRGGAGRDPGAGGAGVDPPPVPVGAAAGRG
ncbi:Aryl-alcohol dehydrogenase [Saccharothrix espanaensis DSM 44229]|uniref:Aryl-alcohol dehydrogenase n=2 Tax=Saccharothrix espanaensis TaxID=103731 RepID=K0JQI8_SACES|nr:Aryl-alcohol dehydrogenase [Saccharothrix espanaensis DSM 44229]